MNIEVFLNFDIILIFYEKDVFNGFEKDMVIGVVVIIIIIIYIFYLCLVWIFILKVIIYYVCNRN